MNVEYADYAVVGESLAGVAAALALAESKGRVVLLDFDRDTDRIVDLPRIQATSLSKSTTGVEFERAFRAVLGRGGVDRQTSCHVTSIYTDKNAIIESTDRRWSCKGVVFAPNGTEPGLHIEGSTALHGFGISYSAAADAPFYASRPVAVYGDAPRVVEQAWIAAQYSSDVVVLVKEIAAGGDVELLSALRSAPAVTFEESAVLLAVYAGRDGKLSAIDIETARGRRSIDVAALFVAQHLVPVMNVVHGETEADSIAFAGLAAGIEYWNHAALVNNGERAARMLLVGG